MVPLFDKNYNGIQFNCNPDKIDAETAEKLKTLFAHCENIKCKVNLIKQIDENLESDQIRILLKEAENSSSYTSYVESLHKHCYDVQFENFIVANQDIVDLLYDLRNVLPGSSSFSAKENLLMQSDFTKDNDMQVLQNVYKCNINKLIQYII